jgi:hypothetical protein
MPNYFENKRKYTCRTCYHCPVHYLTLTEWAPRTNFRRKITRTCKCVVIFHSIIMFKSVLSFAFQAEKDYLYDLYKEGQFLFVLPNSLLPSFASKEMYINSWPTWLIYNIFITGIFYSLSWMTSGACISYTISYKRTKPEAHMKTFKFLTNSSFTICLGNLCLYHDCKD